MRHAITRRTTRSRVLRGLVARLRRLPGLRQPLTWYEEPSAEVFKRNQVRPHLRNERM